MPFVKVAEAGEIEVGRARLVERAGRLVAVFNAGGGRFHALGAECPHELGPLADGWVEAGSAVCPWHGFDFDLRDGRCRTDPALSVPVYPVRLTGTTVEVDLP
jgi:nitrite reductase/ring-hydroxylating ferredoxin subunit